MKQIVVSINTLWFYFSDEKHRRQLHGTVEDCERKLNVLLEQNISLDGVELYIEPVKLQSDSDFSSMFCERFKNLTYRSMHIGSASNDFLHNTKAIGQKLETLSRLLDKLDIRNVVIHAHHLRSKREETRRLFSRKLPGINILVENNGFDNQWGSDINALLEIYKDLPDYRLCLDICHVFDWQKYMVDDFFQNDDLNDRLAEIHFSYSTYYTDIEQNDRNGFDGEKPYHALWSFVEKEPSAETAVAISQYPVVIEGCVPYEDRDLKYLKREVDLLRV
ncbi:MAG: hypothetical protein KAR47_12255 [Planctomycetes bacterium]|nr:hypothetical protein [Planctomycetota bacterium]